ncbi:MAG: hypothetical protein ACI4JA_08170 [Oscillospiraceae bacterium]
MKTTNKNSAKKKLVPAVAMLTTSAIMLSTATYAWFTMNKNVEVKGLSMSATAGDSLEISLGSLAGAAPSNDAPAYNDISWKRSILIDDYYASVGKMLPASTADGLTIYSIDDNKKIYAGGTKVEDDAAVSEKTQGDSVTLTLDDPAETFHTIPDTDPTATAAQGYYIDVPMWIRTTKTTDSTVYCTVNISDNTVGNTDAGNAGTSLKKAVRVAIIPIGTAQSKVGETDGIKDTLALPGSAGYVADGAAASTLAPISNNTVLSGNPVIFGIDGDTYADKVLNSAAAYTAALATAPTIAEVATISGTYVSPTEETPSKNTTVFTIPAAAEDSYSGVSFIARVWLEGESTFCNDATADQDWNIDFHFTLDPVV